MPRLFNKNIQIREAKLEDWSQVSEVHNQSWKTTYQGIINSDQLESLQYNKADKKYWHRSILDTNSVYLVACQEDRIVGYCGAGDIRNFTELKNLDFDLNYTAELYFIYLLEDYQGKGIGKDLFRNVKQWLKEKRYETMVVWTLRQNQNALRFYGALGGKCVSEREKKIENELYKEFCYMFIL